MAGAGAVGRQEVIEAPTEAVLLIQPDRVAGDGGGLVPGLGQALRQRHHPGGHRVHHLVLPLAGSNAVSRHEQPREHRRVRRQGAVGVGEVVVEDDPAFREGVEEGRGGSIVAVEPAVVRPQGVERDQEYVLGRRVRGRVHGIAARTEEQQGEERQRAEARFGEHRHQCGSVAEGESRTTQSTSFPRIGQPRSSSARKAVSRAWNCSGRSR